VTKKKSVIIWTAAEEMGATTHSIKTVRITTLDAEWYHNRDKLP
jgi:hypothetical protein